MVITDEALLDAGQHRRPRGIEITGDLDTEPALLQRHHSRRAPNLALLLHDVIANDEHAVALFTARGERAGRRLEDRTVEVIHIRDGKATEVWLYPADIYASDEFWS